MSKGVNVARSIKPKDALGQPKAALMGMNKDTQGLIIDGQRYTMGYIVGVADKVTEKLIKRPDGGTDSYPVLEGNFEATSSNPDLPATQAPAVFLPEHIHSQIAHQLEAGAQSVSFAFEVNIVSKASSSAGFVWEYAAKGKPAAVDPFAELRALAMGTPAPVAALEKPEGGEADSDSVAQDAPADDAERAQTSPRRGRAAKSDA